MYEEKISAYFDDPAVRSAFVKAVKRLVDVKSVKGEPAPGAPYGPGPRAALDEALKLCSEMGFATRDYDHYVGLADFSDAPTQLHILGHLDVVAEGSGWDTDPYNCVEKDGMLYGRGVGDDKGPVCAALFAMKAVRDLGLPMSKNVRLIMGTDEECGSSDIAYYYAREPFAPQAFTPDASFPLINLEKGHYTPTFGAKWEQTDALPRVAEMTAGVAANVVPPEAEALVLGVTEAEVAGICAEVEKRTGARLTVTAAEGGVRVHSTGRNAHAANPDAGLNAICALLEALVQLPLADCPSGRAVRAMQELFPFGDTEGKALGIGQRDDISGRLTLNLAIVNWDETGFTAKFDSRVPMCATKENCVDVCTAAMEKNGFSILEGNAMSHVHYVEEDSVLVKTLLRCYETYTGEKDAKPLAIGGGTYVHNIPGGVAFGCGFPGFHGNAHSANEVASVDQLLTAAKIFTLAITQLCQ